MARPVLIAVPSPVVPTATSSWMQSVLLSSMLAALWRLWKNSFSEAASKSAAHERFSQRPHSYA